MSVKTIICLCYGCSDDSFGWFGKSLAYVFAAFAPGEIA
jgi:hypothetical protein